MTVVSPGMGGGRDQVVKEEVACWVVTEWSEVGGRLWGTVGGRDQVVKAEVACGDVTKWSKVGGPLVGRCPSLGRAV